MADKISEEDFAFIRGERDAAYETIIESFLKAGDFLMSEVFQDDMGAWLGLREDIGRPFKREIVPPLPPPVKPVRN